MEFKLNGEAKIFRGDTTLSLLNYLRGEAGLISPKDGCAPQAACGSCTVDLEGRAVLSCVIPMGEVAGKHVITTEGLAELERRAFTVAFAEKGAVQCGFCIPGIVMRASTLIHENPDPGRDEIKHALANHLCRCTGYTKIVEATEMAAAAIRERRFLELAPSGGKVGTRHQRYDAEKLTLGERPYVCDMQFENMLYGAFRFSDHPRARVLSIDTARAETAPGVRRVFTAQDIPGKRFIGLIVPDWPVMLEVGETTHYIGDILAGVVAASEEEARAAVALINIEYEVLEPLTDVHETIKQDTPQIHKNRTNIVAHSAIRRGRPEKSLATTDYVISRTYQTQTVEHGYMEPEACIARPENGILEVYSQSQGVYEDLRQISQILNLPDKKINVIMVPNGGGFGGKEDLSVQGQTALFAHLLQAPVKVTLTREESIRVHPKRHPIYLDYTLGCNKDGKLVAMKAHIIGDTGAYASVGMKVLERAAGHATGAYMVPEVDINSYTVYTNNIPNGAMRGFGANQANFAMECLVDELCEAGSFDRWQFRYDNALRRGDMTATGQVLEAGVGVCETLEAVKEKFYAAKFAGLACGIKNTGIGNGMPDDGEVKIKIHSGNEVTIHHGWCEMGQGVNTMAVQTLCEETGIPPGIIRVTIKTADQAPAGMTTASRATSILGNAIIDACKTLKKDLENSSLANLAGNTYHGKWICDWTTKPGKEVEQIITHYSYSYATQLVVLDEQGQLEKVFAAHDAGKIMNPTLFEGQIEGSVHMGLGYALSEDLPYEKGIPKSFRLRDCGILRAKQMPDIEVIGVEVNDPLGPYGAKGVGEIGLVPTAPAVANALYQFDKKRRYSLPMKDFKFRRKGREDIKKKT